MNSLVSGVNKCLLLAFYMDQPTLTTLVDSILSK